MAKKKVSGGIDTGTRIRVKPEVKSNEFPEITIGGWTGTVMEISGKPPSQKFIIEWDDSTISGMPPDYVSRCESQQLYHAMACLGGDEIEVVS
ncbi:MAG: hypothetical protein FJ267_10555 [Planctomycetes bacterium]|nr:hypothetical protein [Planctomycetota bacterium]